MPQVTTIHPDILRNSRDHTRAILKTYVVDGKSFFQHMNERDDSSLLYPTEFAFDAYKSLEQLLTTYQACRDTLAKDAAFRSQDADLSLYISLFSMYAAASEAVDVCSKKYTQDGLNNIDSVSINFRNGVISNVMSSFLKNTDVPKDKLPSGKRLVLQTKGYYQSLLQHVKQWMTQDRFSQYTYLFDQIHLKVDGKIMRGFSWEPYIESGSSALSFDSLVGVSDVASKLDKYARQLFLYDPASRMNIESKMIPRTLLLYSKPGTGKSTLIHIMIDLMKEYAMATKKSFCPVLIDNSIKNMYHGESVKNLTKQLERATNPSGIGLVVIDDIDMVLQSRNEVQANHAELQLVATIMNHISGVYTNTFSGNHMNIFMTNAPEKLDPALLNDRIDEYVFVKGPTTPAEYETALKIELKDVLERKYVVIDRYQEIVALLASQGASGRHLRNIAKRITQEIVSSGPSKEVCGLESAKQEDARSSGYHCIDQLGVEKIVKDCLHEQTNAKQFQMGDAYAKS